MCFWCALPLLLRYAYAYAAHLARLVLGKQKAGRSVEEECDEDRMAGGGKEGRGG